MPILGFGGCLDVLPWGFFPRAIHVRFLAEATKIALPSFPKIWSVICLINHQHKLVGCLECLSNRECPWGMHSSQCNNARKLDAMQLAYQLPQQSKLNRMLTNHECSFLFSPNRLQVFPSCLQVLSPNPASLPADASFMSALNPYP